MKFRHFEIARRASLRSDHPLHHLGAVVAKGNRVIATGYNRYRTNPKSSHPYKHLHAEMDALIRAGDKARGADLYVYREGKDGAPRLGKPCRSCMSLIQGAGIRRIFYTDLMRVTEEPLR